MTTPTPEPLPPEQVPTRLDPLGWPFESVTPVSLVAAQHWDERLWHRS